MINPSPKTADQTQNPIFKPHRVRAVRNDHHVDWLRAQGVEWIARVDREVLATLATESTRLGEALTALAAAAVTVRARLVPHVPPWTLIGQFTHGRLVTPASTG